jgi:hypothetical protein
MKKKKKRMDRDLHFTPFLSLANVIGDENIKVKSWDVIRIPAAQHEFLSHFEYLYVWNFTVN